MCDLKPRSLLLQTCESHVRISGRYGIEEFRAEHDVAVLATLAAENVDHHAFGVDVADLEPGQLGPPEACGIERHQNGAMQRSEG